MPDRFRHEVAYFMDMRSDPTPASRRASIGSTWPRRDSGTTTGRFGWCRRWIAKIKTEVELSEEQEDWLEWVAREPGSHIRLV